MSIFAEALDIQARHLRPLRSITWEQYWALPTQSCRDEYQREAIANGWVVVNDDAPRSAVEQLVEDYEDWTKPPIKPEVA